MGRPDPTTTQKPITKLKLLIASLKISIRNDSLQDRPSQAKKPPRPATRPQSPSNLEWLEICRSYSQMRRPKPTHSEYAKRSISLSFNQSGLDPTAFYMGPSELALEYIPGDNLTLQYRPFITFAAPELPTSAVVPTFAYPWLGDYLQACQLEQWGPKRTRTTWGLKEVLLVERASKDTFMRFFRWCEWRQEMELGDVPVTVEVLVQRCRGVDGMEGEEVASEDAVLRGVRRRALEYILLLVVTSLALEGTYGDLYELGSLPI